MIAGRIDMGLVSLGPFDVFPLGMGVIIACFHACGTEPVTRLAFTMSRSIGDSPKKNFCSMLTLMPSTPVDVDGFIERTVACNVTISIGFTLNDSVVTRGRRVGIVTVAAGTLAAVLGPTAT